MPNVLLHKTKKHEIKIDNFEGPLDLLCHLIDKNKLDIYKIRLSDITDQYIDYINNMEKQNLEVTSEFLIMASTLLYIKSKGLLPKNDDENENELTEEELLRRLVEYKSYKEVAKILKEQYNIYSKRFYKLPDNIKLPKQALEKVYDKEKIINAYKELRLRNESKINLNSKENMERIAISESVTIGSKVKIIFRELLKRPKFVFNKVFEIDKSRPIDVVTAFLGLLEMTRRNKVNVEQEENFSDIIVSKKKKNKV